jgi:DNA-directed RNA polymerase subunit RPC12/RpoP
MTSYQLIAIWNLLPSSERKCSICRRELSLDNLNIHHKNGDRQNNTSENLQITCKNCHNRIHGNENESNGIIIFRVPRDLKNKINSIAQKEKTTKSRVIRRFLIKSLEE